MRRLLLALVLVGGAVLWAQAAPVVPVLPTSRGGTGTASMPTCGAGAVLTRSGSTWSCTSSITTASTLNATLPVVLGGTGLSAACPVGQVYTSDGGAMMCAAASGGAPPAYTLASGAVADVSTFRVAGAAYIDPSILSSYACTWELLGQTTSTGATLYATLHDTADAGMTSTVSVSALSSTRAASGTLSWPSGARLYEARIAFDGGTPGVDYGLAAQLVVRCQ